RGNPQSDTGKEQCDPTPDRSGEELKGDELLGKLLLKGCFVDHLVRRGNQRHTFGGDDPDRHAGADFNTLHLEIDGLTGDKIRGEVIEGWGKSVGLVPAGIAAEAGDLEGRIVENIFELAGQIRTVFSAGAGGHTAEIHVI